MNGSYIYGSSEGNIQSLSLANGVKRVSPVFSDDVPVPVHKTAAFHGCFQSGHSFLQKTTVVVIRHKTDLIAFTLLGKFRISIIMGHLTDLCFPVIAKGKQGATQQILLQTPENIALIF